jgi:hypothetical protein
MISAPMPMWPQWHPFGEPFHRDGPGCRLRRRGGRSRRRPSRGLWSRSPALGASSDSRSRSTSTQQDTAPDGLAQVHQHRRAPPRSGEQIPAPSIPAVRLCRAGGPRSRADGRTAGHERPRRAAVRVRDIPGRPQVPSPVLGGHRGAESRGGLAPARGAPPQGAAAAPAGSPPGPGDNEGPVDARANRMRG